jgi:hypothetical protein
MKGGITTALNKEFAKPGLNKVVLDISKLQNGVYVILLTNEYGKITQHKFVVSH